MRPPGLRPAAGGDQAPRRCSPSAGPSTRDPSVLCAPGSLALEPYLHILQWFARTTRRYASSFRRSARRSRSDIGDRQRSEGQVRAGNGQDAAKTLVAVTNRRIITARTNAFLSKPEIRQDLRLDQVRYVRAATAQDIGGRLAIDLIARDENIRWLFHADIDSTQVDALAAVLAESMMIPDVERDALQQRGYAPIQAGDEGTDAGARSTESPGSGATASDAG